MYIALDYRCSSYQITLIVLPGLRLFAPPNEAISRNQHRHLPRRSCLSKVFLREEFVAHLLDEGHLTNIVNLNFVLMFDSISHWFLHAMRNRFDINGNVLNWTLSYLLGKSYDGQIVGIPSDETPCMSGVFHLSVTVPVREGGWRSTLRLKESCDCEAL